MMKKGLEMKLKDIVQAQRDFFLSGETKNISFRKEKLKKLLSIIDQYEERIYHSLLQDLGKSEYESYLTEFNLVKHEIKRALKEIDKWAKPKKKRTSICTFPNKSYTIDEPYGVVLVLSPWNYPFLLSMLPVIGAITAGNCVVLKVSGNSIHTSKIIREMIGKNMESHFLYVIEEKISYDSILSEKYDYIFFTGSPRVGRIVMRAASENLTPITLELGGKSPCIVDKTADLKNAAKKIIWAKTINAGQTCMAPDYVLIHEDKKEEFIEELKEELEKNYKDCEKKEDYPKIINLHHYIRLKNMIDKESKVIGGKREEKTLKIAPALILDVNCQSEVMRDEIFGPVLPIIGYYQLEALLEELKQKQKPLACYIFSKDEKVIKKIETELSFGGGCINDCLLHIANDHLPFGGVGNSGMGAYHGYYSFKTFSHEKAILKNRGIIDIPHRFPPYTKEKLKQLRKIL